MRLDLRRELLFEVRMPNGELFQTLLNETVPPYPPNPLLQISAVFALVEVCDTQ